MAISQYALVTLAKTKEYLQIEPTNMTDDERLEMLINGVTCAIESYIKWKVMSRVFTELHDGNDAHILCLANTPVINITSIEQIKDDGTILSLGADEYRVDQQNGRVYNHGRWLRGFQNYRFTYTAGYESAPDDIQLACLKWIEYLFKTDHASYSTAFQQAGNATTPPFELPEIIKDLLSPYRRVVL